MTFHRLFSHRSWRAPGLFEVIGSIAGSLGLSGSPLAWVAMHRQHHQYPDRPKDPHSPAQSGLWSVYVSPVFFRPNFRYVRDLLSSPFQKFLHRKYFLINFSFDVSLGLIDPRLILTAHWIPATALWIASWAVNGLGHSMGYRNFKLSDQSRNNLWLGFLVFGEGWHNNHHRYPTRPNFKVRAFEMDMSGSLIKILQRKEVIPNEKQAYLTIGSKNSSYS